MHWWWLIIATGLAFGEIILPGIFLLWLAIAAAITAFLSWLIPGLNAAVAIQLVIFAIFSVIAIYVGRGVIRRNPSQSSDPQLNNRTARLIGEIATVIESNGHGQGRIIIGDGSWPAEGQNLTVGSVVKIVSVNGTILQVEPVQEKG